MIRVQLLAVVLTTVFLPCFIHSASASEGADYNSSRSNKTAAVFVPDGPPCGVPGECFDGSPFGASCTSNADCGGSVCVFAETNVTTAAGEDGCSPFQTYNDFIGNPQGGWVFGPKSKNSLKGKVKKGDLSLKLKLKNVVDAVGTPVDGTGTLALELARRVRDATEGDIALAPIVVTMPVSVSGGKASLSLSLNEALAARGLPSLGATDTEVRVLRVRLLDANGTPVGTVGYGIKEEGVK